jgi:hypothetical protein
MLSWLEKLDQASAELFERLHRSARLAELQGRHFSVDDRLGP